MMRRFLIVFSMFFVFNAVFAGKYKYETVAESVDQINGNTLTLQSNDFNTLSVGSYINKKVYNIVEVYYDFDDVTNMVEVSDAQFDINITFESEGTTTPQSVSKTGLSVNFNKDGATKDKLVYRIEGGTRFTATISNYTGTVFPANLKVRVRMEIERFHNMPAVIYPYQQISYDDTEVATRGELKIKWDQLEGVEWYDLEWAYINYFDEDGGKLPNNEIYVPTNFFKLSSTRISVKQPLGTEQLEYKIPLLYEQGYILYRVRAVGKTSADNFTRYITTAWSAPDAENARTLEFYLNTFSSNPPIYEFSGHEKNLNWQSITNFAEEGKRKVAVSYFDGSLRNRQSVSQLNTEDETIAGETIYDHQGRGAIQILPVPTGEQKLEYNRNFNRSEAGVDPFGREDFDKDATGDSCNVLAPILDDSISGASYYYSEKNTDQQGHQAYLPNANGYPYTQIEYTPDNTGRINRQGGVGADHQLGSGHETRYIYSTPDQEELYRLFGSEVGDASHYKKNTVVDANGQVSISYLDPQGRVIATALEGASPLNVKQLEGGETLNYSVDLLKKSGANDPIGSQLPTEITNDGGHRDFTTIKAVSNPGIHTFSYNTQAKDAFEITPCEDPSFQFCRGCALDLEVSVTNDCGEELLPGGKVLLSTNGDNCSPVQFSPPSWATSVLPIGSYTITKKLSINEAKLDEYTKDYIDTADCLIQHQDFLDEELSKIDTLSCQETCGSCLTKLDEDYPTIPVFGDIEYQAYQDAKQACELLCGPTGMACEISLMAMLADLSPHGQYGLLYEDGPGTEGEGDKESQTVKGPQKSNEIKPEVHPLSVFNRHNRLPTSKYIGGKYIQLGRTDWQAPFTNYRDESGNISYVEIDEIVYKVGGKKGVIADIQSTTPEVHESYIQFNDDKTIGYVIPQHLANVEDFIERWENSWAKALIYFHPEFSYWEDCMKHHESYVFMDEMLRTETLSDAKSKGYIVDAPLSTEGTTNLDVDPIFKTDNNVLDFKRVTGIGRYTDWLEHVEDRWRNQAEKQMNNYAGNQSLWEMAYGLVNCPGDGPDVLGCNSGSTCPEGEVLESNKDWETYKLIYNTYHQHFLSSYLRSVSIRSGYYNGCMNNKNFSPYHRNLTSGELPYSFGGSYGSRSYYHNQGVPCGYYTYRLYKEKIPRFPFNDEVGGEAAANSEYCYDEDFPQVNCAAKFEQMTEDVTLRYNLKIYENCGVCPVLKSIEEFLNGVVEKPTKTLESNFVMGCNANTEVPAFLPQLQTAFGFNPQGRVDWEFVSTTPSIDATGRLVKINLVRYDVAGNSTGNSAELLLKISNVDAEGINVGEVSFSDLIRACCIEVKYVPSLFTAADYSGVSLPLDGKLFGINLVYKDPSNGKEHELPTEGILNVVDLKLDECEFPQVCTIDNAGRELQILMNTLTTDFGTGRKLTALSLDMSVLPYLSFIKLDPAIVGAADSKSNVQEYLMNSDNWTWAASTTTVGDEEILTGTFTVPAGDVDTGQPSSITLTLKMDKLAYSGVDYTFTNIVRFSALRGDSNEADASQNFIINARVKVGTSYEVIPIKGFCSDVSLLKCSDGITVTGGSN